MNHYETVFIVNSILSEQQIKDTVAKFKDILVKAGAEVYHEETWGVRKLAYPINKRSNGYYQLFEFKAPAKTIATLDTEFRRDENIIRSLTVSLDKYGVEFNERRRSGAFTKTTSATV